VILDYLLTTDGIAMIARRDMAGFDKKNY